MSLGVRRKLDEEGVKGLAEEGREEGWSEGEDLLTFNTPNTRDEKIIAFSRQMIKYLINTHVFFVSAQCPSRPPSY